MELKIIGKQTIGNYEFTGIKGGFGNDKKAMLVKDIAEIHEADVRTINQSINRNIKRFKAGVDIIDLKSVITPSDSEQFGFTLNQWNPSKNIYILSERGYSKLLKILEDDKAWEIYDLLVDEYFELRNGKQTALPTDPMDIFKLTFEAQEQTNERVTEVEKEVEDLKNNQKIGADDYGYISRRINQRVTEVARGFGKITQKQRGELYKDINTGVKKVTGVGTRSQLREKHYQIVLDFINDWEPSTATKTIVRQMSLDLEDIA